MVRYHCFSGSRNGLSQPYVQMVLSNHRRYGVPQLYKHDGETSPFQWNCRQFVWTVWSNGEISLLQWKCKWFVPTIYRWCWESVEDMVSCNCVEKNGRTWPFQVQWWNITVSVEVEMVWVNYMYKWCWVTIEDMVSLNCMDIMVKHHHFNRNIDSLCELFGQMVKYHCCSGSVNGLCQQYT